jgi:hypothetical protein
VNLPGGKVDVSSGVGFVGADPLPLVRVKVTDTEGNAIVIWLTPVAAREVGVDLIGSATASLGDAGVRIAAKQMGIDGDSIIGEMRRVAQRTLGAGGGE